MSSELARVVSEMALLAMALLTWWMLRLSKDDEGNAWVWVGLAMAAITAVMAAGL